jgi:ribosome maturation factor RimP
MANIANIEEKVEGLLKPIIENLGYELYDVIFEKEAQDYYLRIFIDNEQGISLNDCEKVNDAISDMLDEANYIKGAYFLEVSSPGIERFLRKDKHFKESIGKKVEINLFSPITIEKIENQLVNENNQKENNNKKKNKKPKLSTTKQLEGILKSFDNEKIILTIEENKIAKKQTKENKKGKQKIEKQEKLENQEQILEIPRKNITIIKLKYEWE